MAAQTTFTMNPTTLARAVAGGAARERRRIATMIDDEAAIELGRGQVALANVLTVLAETVRSSGPPHPAEIAGSAGDRDFHKADPIADRAEHDALDEEELPAVHHRDDFAEGVSLVRGRQQARQMGSGLLRD